MNPMNARGLCSRSIFAAVVLLTLPMSGTLFAQPSMGDGSRVGVPVVGTRGIQETVEQIMARAAVTPPRLTPRIHPDHVHNRQDLPQNPLSANDAQSPAGVQLPHISSPFAPQTITTTFTGATLADTFAFPPDTMGAVGPTQFIVAVNGRIRSFNKSTGLADGVLNADPDVFFNSVMTPPLSTTFTSDPRIRYDRLSARWFISIIDVPGVPNPGSLPNRVLLAVSDATSAGVISSSTGWTFFFFQGDATNFTDYDTLGIDVNALYIGANMFTPTGSFVGTNAYVVRKSSILGAGPIVVTTFANLTIAGPGPWTPQGVDNLYDAGATEGYFIGVDNLTFGTLMLRRVSDPGGTPTISGNISITVSSTTFPLTVPHLGNTGGTNGKLDALDDRLFAAQMRGGRLWTAHNIRVNSSGVAATGTSGDRDGTRWYELQNIASPGPPTIRQSGTVFDNAATNPRSYWIPSIAVSGQGHAALGFSSAGAAAHIDAGTVGRLSGDTLGTMQAPLFYTATSMAYNPPTDPGGAGGRRWGDYSYTTLDPNDDMTLWTIQEFCEVTNSYSVRVAKLVAPPPATPVCTVPTLMTASTQNVTITGISTSGSGFFDPGSGFPNRLQASVSGGVTVNSVTYNNPTSVTLNITSTTNGLKSVTLTNPDGQNVVGSNCINVNIPAAARVFLSGTGSDIGDCLNAATPCRSLQGAIDQAVAGAEVVVVSSGGYGGATINKSITVSAPTGVIAFVGRTITVNIASSDTVTLRGLSMNGAVFGDLYGINFIAGGTLNIENSVIASFIANGVYDTAAGSNLWVHNCDFKKNTTGLIVSGASAVIENSRAVENSSIGMWAHNSSTVAIRNSVAQGNGTGFYADSTAGGSTELTIDSCMSTNNGYGLYSNQSGPGSVATLRAGKNIVMNNTNTNLATAGGSGLISQGGNRIGGATGGTTGFTGTVGQQ